MLARRRELASRYDDSFRDDARIATPVVPDYAEWNVQTYTVRLAGFDATRRDRVMACMLDAGIATRAGVMTAHREPAYASWWTEPLPISEAASDGSLVLPLHGDLTEDDQARVTNALVAALDEVT
jgi:perosamine synthetase